MPQLFPPKANPFSLISIFALVLIGGAVLAALVWYAHSPAVTRVGVPIDQPVPFSHQLHVSVVGLDCRLCHTAVEDSSFADIPPTHTCMTCHSQVAVDRPSLEPVRESFRTGEPIQWVRVNSLPDFTYFNHSIHVNKGVGCETCHGRVDQMGVISKVNAFYMSWCLECHEAPERFVRPLENVYDMGWEPDEDQLSLGRRLVGEYNIASPQQLINCSVCHR